MKGIIRDFKLLKYGFQFKSNMFVGFLFFIMGVVFLFLGSGMEVMGAVYVTLGSIFMSQVMMLLTMADTVSASPRKRSIVTKTVMFMNAVGTLIGYLITLVSFWWRYSRLDVIPVMDEDVDIMVMPTEQSLAMTLVEVSLLIGIILFYFVFAYKKMILSTIVMIVAIVAGMPVTMMTNMARRMPIGNLTMVQGTLISALILVVVTAICCVLQKTVYRLEMDKWGAGAALRKYL